MQTCRDICFVENVRITGLEFARCTTRSWVNPRGRNPISALTEPACRLHSYIRFRLWTGQPSWDFLGFYATPGNPRGGFKLPFCLAQHFEVPLVWNFHVFHLIRDQIFNMSLGHQSFITLIDGSTRRIRFLSDLDLPKAILGRKSPRHETRHLNLQSCWLWDTILVMGHHCFCVALSLWIGLAQLTGMVNFLDPTVSRKVL